MFDDDDIQKAHRELLYCRKQFYFELPAPLLPALAVANGSESHIYIYTQNFKTLSCN